MIQDNSTIFVKALYPFKGSNNDELVFKQGDIITITQKVEEGWCEGTLNGKTGWFPSNYVKEFKPELNASGLVANNTEGNLQSREYRNQVLKDMIESETAHVQELSSLFKTYLQPLKKSNILDDYVYQQMVGNYEQVLTIQTQLLHKLEESLGFIGKDQRVGSMFMQMAPHFKKIHLTYCANHPKAVVILGENKESLSRFIESLGVQSAASLMTLTTALSKPFRRLERYQGLLQELERHTDESHIDRGDCQRAVAIYRDIAIACNDKRRQKEMELEVLIPGRIREWEGDDITLLGDIIHMSQVGVYLPESRDSTARDKKDRYFVLFPQTLLMLSVSHRLSAFIYEGKLPLSGITVQKLDNSELKNAFEISGNMIEQITVSCNCRDDRDSWVDLLNDQICVCHMASSTSSVSSSKSRTLPAFRNTMQDQLLLRNPANNLAPMLRNSMQNQKSSHGTPDANIAEMKSPVSNPMIPPHRSPTPPLPPSFISSNESNMPKISNQMLPQLSVHGSQSKHVPLWTMSCLRPSPPLRPCISSSESNKKSSTKKKVEERSYEDDMKILRVIEAYCTSAKTRNTVNSALLDCPQVFIAEEEKMIVEETKGNQTIVEERSLVDTVYALKDEVKELFRQTSTLSSCLEDEKKARLRLEGFIKKHVLIGREDLCWDD